MHDFIAIAAMAENRVIGAGNRIPWHLPEDFKWFKSITTGHTLVMGRKTFESIGRPLPNRTTLVLSRGRFEHPGVRSIASLAEALPAAPGQKVFICGGGEIYKLALPYCSEIYLTKVHRVVEGDAYFPEFESDFEPRETPVQTADFTVTHYRRTKG
jgi:dihydrofolate reductase